MGEPKAALRVMGETFVTRIARVLDSAGLAPLVVVAGEHTAQTRAALRQASPLTLLENPSPERGQLSSLQLALRWLLDREEPPSAALVALVDHPLIQQATVEALVRAARPAPRTAIVLPHTSAGGRGHPVVFWRQVWQELLDTPPELGARAVVRADPTRVLEIQVDDPGIHIDVDTPADLRALEALSRGAR